MALCAGLLVLAALLVAPFVSAILWALVLSLLTYPLYHRLRARRGDTVAALIMTVGTAFVLCVPLFVLGALIYLQIQALGGELNQDTTQAWFKQIETSLAPVLNMVGLKGTSLTALLNENRDEIVQALKSPLGKFVKDAGRSIFTLVVALLTMFFMLRLTGAHYTERLITNFIFQIHIEDSAYGEWKLRNRGRSSNLIH